MNSNVPYSFQKRPRKMNLEVHLATEFKDFLLSWGATQIPIDQESGVMKFNVDNYYIRVNRYFPDEHLTIEYPTTLKCKSLMEAWRNSQKK